MIKFSVITLRHAVVIIAFACFAPGNAEANLDATAPLEPAQAIEMVNSAPRQSVKGTFIFEIAGTGRGVARERGLVYLNSMKDYRDPGSITVVIRRGLLKKVKHILGGELESLVGKRVRVEGELRRVRIYFPLNLGETEARYYYQNHVHLDSASSIALVDQ